MEEKRLRWEYQETAKITKASGTGILNHFGNIKEGGDAAGESGKFTGECHNCGRKGHRAADCRKEKKPKIEGKPSTRYIGVLTM